MKKLVIIVLLFIIILINNITFAQTLKLGFGIEPSFLFYDNKNESSISFIPYSANLKVLIASLNWLNFEARPGIFFGGQDYSWIELGGYARFNILPTRFYIIAGVNDYIRGGYDDILFNGIGIGFQKDSKASFDLIFYWKSFVNDEKINGILKVNISFAWDIL